jgi:UDP-glucose 4-epimerase
MILVTGAAGFIGSELCSRLLASNRPAVGYDNLSRGRREHVPAGATLVEGDIRDASRLSDVVAAHRPHVVVHLAAMHFIPECIARPAETLDVNVEGTRTMLECCRRHGVRRLIFASTAAVYAPGEEPCREDETPIGPVDVYGESKVEGERLVRAFQAETGAAACVLRLFNAIGRRETNPHVVPHIFEALRASDAIALGNTAPERDYVDTRDIADAILAAAGLHEGLHVLNVGTGVGRSVEDIVAALQGILGRPLTIVREPSRVRATERMRLVADIRKIRQAASWAPRIPFEQTLRDLADAYGLAASGEGRPPRAIQTPPSSTPAP